jgi:hypothetical protein
MRYSEAVKRHKFETKQRIFNSIMEAAEKEKSAARSAYAQNIKIDTAGRVKKEAITMSVSRSNSEINEVRSRKGGVIAAACAVLVIGGGVAMFANSGSIDVDNIMAGSAASEGAESDIASSSEAPKTEGAVTENAVTDTESRNDNDTSDTDTNTDNTADNGTEQGTAEITDSDDSTAEPAEEILSDTQIPIALVTDDIPELMAANNNIFAGKVTEAEPADFTLADGSTLHCIAYTLTDVFCLDTRTDILTGNTHETRTVYQTVSEDSVPQFKAGETALIISAKGRLNGKETDFAVGDSVFGYANHRYYCITRASDKDLCDNLKSYIVNTVLEGRSSNLVYGWFDLHGESYIEEYDLNDAYKPSYTAAFIRWDDTEQLYKFSLNITPQMKTLTELTDQFESGHLVSDPTTVKQSIEGFDGLDITFNGLEYYPDKTALVLSVEVSPKEGSDIHFDDRSIYKLITDPEDVDDIFVGMNTDAFLSAEAIYYPQEEYQKNSSKLVFNLAFDQAGDDGPVDLTPGKMYKFSFSGISVGLASDPQLYDASFEGRCEVSFRLSDNIMNLEKVNTGTPVNKRD